MCSSTITCSLACAPISPRPSACTLCSRSPMRLRLVSGQTHTHSRPFTGQARFVVVAWLWNRRQSTDIELVEQMFLQGNIDNDGQLSTRFNWRWSQSLVTKTQFQIGTGGQDMAQWEQEYTGKDFTASIKGLNPSYLEGGLTGIFIGSYMQAVTPKLALGLEAMWQRPALSQPPEAMVAYCGKYKSEDWIATAQLSATGGLNTTYWRKLSDKVQAGVDMSLTLAGGAGAMMGGPLQKEGTTTFGAKYDFRMSTFRAQLDSKGKLSCLLEKRVAGPVMMTVGADVDHATVSPVVVRGLYG